MASATRVDKVVWLRERKEDGALAALARARAEVDRARADAERAAEETRRDERTPGRVELWLLDEDGHRRAVQALHVAQRQVGRASAAEAVARDGYTAARRDTLTVRRVQERRRADARAEGERRERRAVDEIATLRFNAG